ncbi:MAG: hypothetical protein LBT20_04690 [Clostridiales bacterium]|nr:hypothetical protein [Clostridiales bacterium]
MALKTEIIEYVEKSLRRGFASFGGICPIACNHCYTFMRGYQHKPDEKVDDIVNSLKGKVYDIIYISGHCENFINQEQGFELCEKLFSSYNCDIMLTTRMVLDVGIINRLSSLNKKMCQNGNTLFVCSSIPALESYRKLEPSKYMPSPRERIRFLRDVHNEGIITFLTLRPLFPDYYINTTELLQLIDEAQDASDIVLSSGIVVNEDNLKKLCGFNVKKATTGHLMNCLDNADISVQYVDVTNELKLLNEKSCFLQLPFFSESLIAVKFLKLVSNFPINKRYDAYKRYMSALNGDIKAIDDFMLVAKTENEKAFWSGLKEKLKDSKSNNEF